MTETLNTLRTAEQAYADSREASNKAWKAYNEAVDDCERGRSNRRFVDLRYSAALALDTQASVTWKAYDNAKAAHLAYLASQDEDCTCTPVSTCEPCAQRARNSDLEF